MKSVALAAVTAVLLAAAGCGAGPDAEAAKPARDTTAGGGPETTLTFVTYNVLADPARAGERLPALLKLLGDSSADVIALQEVSPWFAERLLSEDWAKGYRTTLGDARAGAPGGLAILSRLPIEKQEYRPLPSRQGRGVLTVRLRAQGRSLAVATVHLESPLESGEARARQLDTVLPLLDGADDAVLLGDFNFGDGEQPATGRLPAAFKDLWPALRPGEPGLTWNMEKSAMARAGSFPGEKSRRLDRILVRSDFWTGREVRMVGDEPVAAGDATLFPSDHFGLSATLAHEAR